MRDQPPRATALPIARPQSGGDATAHTGSRAQNGRPTAGVSRHPAGFESEMQGVFPRRGDDGQIRYFTYVVREEGAGGDTNTPTGARGNDRAG